MRKNVLEYLLSIIVLNFFISSTNNHLYGRMKINTNNVSTSFNNNSLVNKNTTQYKRDLIHSQEAWIHEYSQKNDVVTWVQFNPDSLRHSRIPTITGTPLYSIYSDPSGMFIMDGNYLKLNDVSKLETSVTYNVKVLCEVQDMWDIAEITVHSIDAKSIKYIDLNAINNGDGTFTNPYNKPQTILSDNIYYFYKRGSSYKTLGATIQFGEGSKMVAYGQGSRPRIVLSNNDGDDFGILIDSKDNCVLSGLEFDCGGNVPRAIQINTAGTQPNYNTKILGCRIDSAGIGIWSDEVTFDLLIQDNGIYNSGLDGMYLEAENSEIVANIIRGMAREDTDGDGIQLTITNYKNRVAHNYINFDNNPSVKAIIISIANYKGLHGDTTFCTIEHNLCYAGTSGGVRNGINSKVYGDTIRYNYIDEQNGVPSINVPPAIRVENGSTVVHNNSIYGWYKGIEVDYKGIGEDIEIYNNIINGPSYHIDAEGDNYSLIISNNIFLNRGSSYYRLNSTNGTIETKNNLFYKNNDAIINSYIDGKLYNTLSEAQNNGFEKNSLQEAPEFNSSLNPQQEGNLFEAGTKIDFIEYDFLGNKIENLPEIGILELTDGQSSVIIDNNAPIIQEQTLTMTDTLSQGLSFAKIIASETDEGQTYYFKIVSGNSENTFSVDSINGSITYNGNSRINEIGNFRLRIAVTDNGQPPLSSEADIRIEIEHILVENTDDDSENKSGETTDNTATTKITTFYIDPKNVSDSNEDGSKEHPFDSWTDITWTDNSTYLQKNGTTTYIEKLLITANNITIGSYGDNEEQPVIVSNTKEYAIKAYDKKNIIISGLNIIAEEAVGTVYFLGSEADSIVVEKCTFSNSVFGIRIMEGKNFTVRYNTFKNNYTAVHSTAETTSIYYNIFQSNDMSINLMSYLSTSEVYNNTFYENSIAISTSYGTLSMYNNIFYLAKDNDVALQSSQSKLFSDYNLFYPENDGFINIEDTMYNTLESFQAAKKLDLSSLNSDPLFVDMYNDNFMVSSQSPAIENGKLFGELTDFFGSPVPLGDYPDIGAHEVNLKSGEMTGITDKKIENSVSVYPNPSQGIINIKNDYGIFENGFTLTVINTDGRTVFHKKSYNSRNMFNLNFLPKGLYLLNISDNKNSITKKVLLE